MENELERSKISESNPLGGNCNNPGKEYWRPESVQNQWGLEEGQLELLRKKDEQHYRINWIPMNWILIPSSSKNWLSQVPRIIRINYPLPLSCHQGTPSCLDVYLSELKIPKLPRSNSSLKFESPYGSVIRKSPIPTFFSDQSLHLLALGDTWLFSEDTEFPAALMSGSHFLSHSMYHQARRWYRQTSCFSLPLPNHCPFLALPHQLLWNWCHQTAPLSRPPCSVALSCPPDHSHTVLGDFNSGFTVFLSAILLQWMVYPISWPLPSPISLFAVILSSATSLQPPSQLSLHLVIYNCPPQSSQFQAYYFYTSVHASAQKILLLH